MWRKGWVGERGVEVDLCNACGASSRNVETGDDSVILLRAQGWYTSEGGGARGVRCRITGQTRTRRRSAGGYRATFAFDSRTCDANKRMMPRRSPRSCTRVPSVESARIC